ncbi:TlpA family protein disulfide reductase [Fodinicola acaciae]|uniref:TlpA family protein disulfide reductase n=1 Tax=Fodinicola acaciae TaxID=2681555 RepID=UPI0013D6D75D|nr:TlpA disulfide reductase family protein [Fodinicola acaciae]
MTAFVAVVGALSLVNLLLCIGIVRRLREHTDILNTKLGDNGPAPMYAAGQRIGDFQATTVDGAAVSRDALTGTTLLGAFTPGCTPCKERLPLFIEQAAQRDRDQVLAIVSGTVDDAADYVARLSAVARVVREEDGGPVTTAFGVEGFPAFALIDTDGVVLASGTKLGALAMPVPA